MKLLLISACECICCVSSPLCYRHEWDTWAPEHRPVKGPHPVRSGPIDLFEVVPCVIFVLCLFLLLILCLYFTHLISIYSVCVSQYFFLCLFILVLCDSVCSWYFTRLFWLFSVSILVLPVFLFVLHLLVAGHFVYDVNQFVSVLCPLIFFCVSLWLFCLTLHNLHLFCSFCVSFHLFCVTLLVLCDFLSILCPCLDILSHFLLILCLALLVLHLFVVILYKVSLHVFKQQKSTVTSCRGPC